MDFLIDWLIDWLVGWFFMVGYDGIESSSKWCRCLGDFPFFRRACERWSFVRLWATVSRREKWSRKLMRSGHCSDGMPLSRMQSWAGGRKWRHWRCHWWRPTPMTQRYRFFSSIVPNISLNASNSIFNFILIIQINIWVKNPIKGLILQATCHKSTVKILKKKIWNLKKKIFFFLKFFFLKFFFFRNFFKIFWNFFRFFF